jgi:hypothetical protein
MTDSILGEDIMGDDYEVEGDDYEVEGAARPRIVRPTLRLPPKPGWRKMGVAPGVSAPSALLQPLPLRGEANNGVFTADVRSILFQGIPQRPFRGERLVIAARQTATSTVQLRVQTLTVGTNVQSVQVADMPIEAFAATAYDVRMKLQPAQPGVLIQCQIYAVGSFATGEEIPCAVVLLGHAIG